MFCASILFGLLIVPIGFLAGFAGGMPDQFTAPFVEQWPLLKVLWASNPEAAIRIALQQPLLVMAHSGPAGGIASWKLFLLPVPLMALSAVAIFAAAILSTGERDETLRRLGSLLPGMALLVFATTYVQVAACCTGGPRWVLDILLFSQAYDPLSRLIDWQQLYLRVEGFLPFAQAVLALLGMVLLATAGRTRGAI